MKMPISRSRHDNLLAIEKARTERIASKWAKAMEDLEKRDEKIDGLVLALSAATHRAATAEAKIERMTGGLRNHKPKPTNGAAVRETL